MQLDVHAKDIDLIDSLRIYVEEKIGGIEKFIDAFDLEGGVSIRVKLERTTNHHKKGDVYQASADLHLPGKSMHASASHYDMHAAIDELRDKLLHEIETLKGKVAENG